MHKNILKITTILSILAMSYTASANMLAGSYVVDNGDGTYGLTKTMFEYITITPTDDPNVGTISNGYNTGTVTNNKDGTATIEFLNSTSTVTVPDSIKNSMPNK